MIMGLDRTYHAHQFIFSFFSFTFLFFPCGRLSWLSVRFLLHVNYTVSYRMPLYCCCTALLDGSYIVEWRLTLTVFVYQYQSMDFVDVNYHYWLSGSRTFRGFRRFSNLRAFNCFTLSTILHRHINCKQRRHRIFNEDFFLQFILEVCRDRYIGIGIVSAL